MYDEDDRIVALRGQHIPMAHLIFDLQSFEALAEERAEAARRAEKG